MHFLKSMFEHGSVSFLQQFAINVHFVVRIDSQKIVVVGRVMDLAHAQSIWNGGKSLFVGVGEDVSSVEKFGVMESADRAAVFIREKHFASEFPLMNALFDHSLYVGA